ncbi:MAG: FAD-dependent monooxygenase [Polyangiaceae bacterium]
MNESTLRVAIVGAGIGGLAAAIAMSRDGHDVHVYEKAKALRAIGAGIHVSPNGVRLLERLGLGADLQRIGALPEHFEFRRWDDDRLLQRHEINPFCSKAFGAPFYCFHRGELHEVLLGKVAADRVHVGAQCVDVTQGPEGAAVHLEDGRVVQADVVVGADGIRSHVRSRFVADEPRFGGMHTFRGLVPAEKLESPRPLRNIMWLGAGRVMIVYPVSGGKTFNFTGVYPSSDPRTESWTAAGSKEEVLGHFAGWSPILRHIIASTDELLVYPLFDRLPVRTWGEGRVTLLGDAAHPMFPFLAQGAVQAIEDAWVLAQSLRGVRGSGVPEALRRYEARRMLRTAAIQERSAGANWLMVEDGPAQTERDAWLADFRGDPSAWLHGFDAETDAPFRSEEA